MQGPGLQLIIEPGASVRLTMHDAEQARRGEEGGTGPWRDRPFGESLLLDINPLLLDRQHLQLEQRHARADWRGSGQSGFKDAEGLVDVG